ncbi:hypothetical protein OHB26_10785 [Nocardia sp. NBC_01503]|uniref:hypothetical protein n=1 Tax=Nocardia sp. NBC_01503 TaxID=2975997 RepID=UPI002E7B3BFB|nr:hypothetical protein [Nocardia sp. NBC_01503]WTL34630.1 hypothetical protein OHB26_10785 [Nocardia sp. NBC_01503]
MRYPYGQPEYPGQGQPGYSQQGYPQPGFGYPQPSYPGYSGSYPTPPVSGSTAIGAAVIALVVGALAGFGGLLKTAFGSILVSSNSTDGYYSSSLAESSKTAIIVGVFLMVLGVLWLVSALLLIARKTAGRVLLIFSTTMGMVGTAVGMVTDPDLSDLVGFAIEGLILVLAAVPPTGRWLAADKNPPPAVPGYMPYPYA